MRCNPQWLSNRAIKVGPLPLVQHALWYKGWLWMVYQDANGCNLVLDILSFLSLDCVQRK